MHEIKNKNISGFKTVLVSSLVSVLDIVISFIVAALTGSAVMFAQGMQGFADLVTTLFLLLGVKRSKRSPTASHPFGFGRELFFWVLLSSLFAFLFSGGLASYRALQEILHGGMISSVSIALIALSFGLISNAYSLSISVRRLSMGVTGKSYFSYVWHSSLVETKMTLLVDFMGTLSAIFGLCAIGLYTITGNAIFDGIGALLIGLLTAGGALVVIVDLHDLIIGRSPHPGVIESIRKAALSVDGVNDVLDLRAISIGSEKTLVILEIHFADDMTTNEIEQTTDKIKDSVIKKVPQISRVQVEVESPD